VLRARPDPLVASEGQVRIPARLGHELVADCAARQVEPSTSSADGIGGAEVKSPLQPDVASNIATAMAQVTFTEKLSA
jgi:hypothetical protein